jgi:hypothetical protein
MEKTGVIVPPVKEGHCAFACTRLATKKMNK